MDKYGKITIRSRFFTCYKQVNLLKVLKMQFSAKVQYIRISPSKLRVLVDPIRKKSAKYVIQWLTTLSINRAVPIKKMIESAVANAKHLQDVGIDDLSVKEIRVDQARIQKSYKPGAMGRANPQRKRYSHMKVILESKSVEKKEV